jgi:hypothetical protein
MEGYTDGFERAVFRVQAIDGSVAQYELVAYAVLREGKIVRSEYGVKHGKGAGTKPGVTKRVPRRRSARATDVKTARKPDEPVLGDEEMP